MLLYEMLVGLPPFYDGAYLATRSGFTHFAPETGSDPFPFPFTSPPPPEITDKMYEKILRDPLVFPDEVSPSARSILTGLLTRDPAQRLGVNGAEEIKRHPFFEKIDWRRLAQKKIQPPFKPSVRSPVDVSNFDTVFTAEQPLDSVVEGSQLSQTVQAQFEGAMKRFWFFDNRKKGLSLTDAGLDPFVGFSYNARGLNAHAE